VRHMGCVSSEKGRQFSGKGTFCKKNGGNLRTGHGVVAAREGGGGGRERDLRGQGIWSGKMKNSTPKGGKKFPYGKKKKESPRWETSWENKRGRRFSRGGRRNTKGEKKGRAVRGGNSGGSGKQPFGQGKKEHETGGGGGKKKKKAKELGEKKRLIPRGGTASGGEGGRCLGEEKKRYLPEGGGKTVIVRGANTRRRIKDRGFTSKPNMGKKSTQLKRGVSSGEKKNLEGFRGGQGITRKGKKAIVKGKKHRISTRESGHQ